MEFWLLAKVAMVVNGIQWASVGTVAVLAISKVGRYIRDYRESVEEERVMKVNKN